MAYLADDPSARWIAAGRGAFPNGGRNVLPLEHINNVDFSLGKRFNVTESKRIEFRANLYNALNNPQFIPGSLNSVRAVSSDNTRANLIPGNELFNKPEEVYLSHACEIHLVLRFTF